MGKSSKPPAPPDTSRFSEQIAAQSREQHGWARQMWEQGQEEYQRISQWTQDYMGFAMPAAEEAFDWAREQRDRFVSDVLPQYESLFSEAEKYASKEEETRQRGKAIQDVASATEAERASHLRNLGSYGLDTAKERELGIDRQAGVTAAGLKAMAANLAGERTQEVGRDLRDRAITAGSAFMDDATRNTALGAQVGGSAMSGAGTGTQSGLMARSGALPFSGASQRGQATAAGIVDTSYGRQLDYTEAKNAAARQDFDMYSGIAGGIMTMWDPTGLASKTLKTAGGAKAAEGGPISAPGGPGTDGGAIAISDGEYVIPADVVRRLGTNHFDKMIEKETGRPPPSQKQAIPIPGGR